MNTESRLRELEQVAKFAIDTFVAGNVSYADSAMRLIMIERGYKTTSEIETASLADDDHLMIWLHDRAEWLDLASKAHSIVHSAFKDERLAQLKNERLSSATSPRPGYPSGGGSRPHRGTRAPSYLRCEGHSTSGGARSLGEEVEMEETDPVRHDRIVAQVFRLQDRRDYADEVEAAKLTAEIERLLDIIEPQEVTT